MTYRGFITRGQWGARKPESRSTNIQPEGQLTHWMGGRVGNISHTRCFEYVRGVQNFHMDTRDYVDIAYSLMSCRHGYLFAGRGRGVRTAANGSAEANSRFHANALLFGPGDNLTNDMVDAHWTGYTMLGGGLHRDHRDYRQTECPGDEVAAMTDQGPPNQGPPDMAQLTDKELEFLRDLIQAVNGRDSNPRAFAYMIDHLRDHPSSGGGLSAGEVRAIVDSKLVDGLPDHTHKNGGVDR